MESQDFRSFHRAYQEEGYHVEHFKQRQPGNQGDFSSLGLTIGRDNGSAPNHLSGRRVQRYGLVEI